jgi:cell division protein FtsI (penicillin-binding protein 3)
MIYVFVLLIGLAIVGKIAYLQWVEGDMWKLKSKEMNIRYKNISARRGNIYSDNEDLLASSVTVYDLGMDVNPKIVPDSIFNRKIDSLALRLGWLFHQPKSSFLSKLKHSRRVIEKDSNAGNYVLLKRNISYAQLEKIKTFPIFRLGRLKGGLVADGMELREHPFRNLAQRTIGYVHPAQYDVALNLSKGKISREQYESEADTLALYMYNLFHDGVSKRITGSCWIKAILPGKVSQKEWMAVS